MFMAQDEGISQHCWSSRLGPGPEGKDAGETVEGYPVRTEVDMSGLGLRIGIRLYNFGL